MIVPVDKVFIPQAASESSANMDAQLFAQLDELWTSHRAQSLEVRLKTGSLLNEHLGDPTTRQPRGPSVIKQAAKRLRIAESELSRMRWYKYFSDNNKLCWGEVPNKERTWTKFKEILPGLKRTFNEGNGKQQPSSAAKNKNKKRKSAILIGLFKSIESTTTKFRAGNITVDGTQRDELIRKIQELASAVSNVTGVCVRVETEENVREENIRREDDVASSHVPRGVLVETAAQCPDVVMAG